MNVRYFFQPSWEGDGVMDRAFLVPNNYDKVLKTTFGDYMTLPKEENRYGHALFYSLQKNI